VIRFLFLLWMLAPPAAMAQAPEEVPRPDIRVGDRWTYRDLKATDPRRQQYEIQVTFVDEKSIVGYAAFPMSERESDAVWTAEWNAVSGANGLVFRPSGGLFRFPLHAGKTYRSAFESERPRDGRGVTRVSMTVVVTGWEEIEVPAGRFRALRIEATHDGRKDGPQVIAWYSPGVKRWVRYRAAGTRADRDEVLLEYQVK
jgi:hypothetical protein